MSNEVEQVFAGMVLERTLKSGSNSSVCLVHDETGKSYIYRWFPGTDAVYQRLRGISSPYLPKIYDVKTRGDTVYVLEEYVCGDSLAFLLEAGPLTPAWVQRISVQLCEALSQLHHAGIVHRDVKPENILLRGSDAVLIDFDASRVAKPSAGTDTRLLGTAGYAAPEQYGFSQTDQRADIYSIGIVINEMLTGQHPSKQLAEGRFRPVVERCIEVNVDRRFSSADALRLALKTCRSRGWARCWRQACWRAFLRRYPCSGPPSRCPRPRKPGKPARPKLGPPSRRQWQRSRGRSRWIWRCRRFPMTWTRTGHRRRIFLVSATQACRKRYSSPVRTISPWSRGRCSCARSSPVSGSRRRTGRWFRCRNLPRCCTMPPSGCGGSRSRRWARLRSMPRRAFGPGGLSITFGSEHQGTWLYQIQATLDGAQLTAQAITTVDSMENYRKIMEQNHP